MTFSNITKGMRVSMGRGSQVQENFSAMWCHAQAPRVWSTLSAPHWLRDPGQGAFPFCTSVFSSAHHTNFISPGAHHAFFLFLNGTRLVLAPEPFHLLFLLPATPLTVLCVRCPSLSLSVTSSESLLVAFSTSPHPFFLVPVTL